MLKKILNLSFLLYLFTLNINIVYSSYRSWHEECQNDKIKQEFLKFRHQSYSIQLCSFEIHEDEKLEEVLKNKLEECLILLHEKKYNSPSYSLFVAKYHDSHWAYCAWGKYNTKSEARGDLRFLKNIFGRDKIFIRKPSKIDLPLNFVILYSTLE